MKPPLPPCRGLANPSHQVGLHQAKLPGMMKPYSAEGMSSRAPPTSGMIDGNAHADASKSEVQKPSERVGRQNKLLCWNRAAKSIGAVFPRRCAVTGPLEGSFVAISDSSCMRMGPSPAKTRRIQPSVAHPRARMMPARTRVNCKSKSLNWNIFCQG